MFFYGFWNVGVGEGDRNSWFQFILSFFLIVSTLAESYSKAKIKIIQNIEQKMEVLCKFVSKKAKSHSW